MQVTYVIVLLSDQEKNGAISEGVESHYCLSKLGYMKAFVKCGLKHSSESKNDSELLKQL